MWKKKKVACGSSYVAVWEKNKTMIVLFYPLFSPLLSKKRKKKKVQTLLSTDEMKDLLGVTVVEVTLPCMIVPVGTMVEWSVISQPALRHSSHIWYKLKHVHKSIFAFVFFLFFYLSQCAGCTQKPPRYPETTMVTLNLYTQVDVLDRETSRCNTFTTRRVWLKLWIIVEPLLL